MVALSDFTPLQGGVPLIVDGQIVGAVGVSGATSAQEDEELGRPGAVIDLATDQGVHVVKGQWRYSDTHIVDTEFLAPGSDGQPGRTPIKTYD